MIVLGQALSKVIMQKEPGKDRREVRFEGLWEKEKILPPGDSLCQYIS